MISDKRLKKGYLQWRCRRGTKELDIILNKFLEANYVDMLDVDLLQFDALLDSQDTQLWYWLSGQKICNEPKLLSIITMITDSKSN